MTIRFRAAMVPKALAAVMAALAVLLAPAAGVALARPVTVQWINGAANATVSDRPGALASGFRTAVVREALDLLPGPIDEARQALLWDYLAPGAGNYVQSYSETRYAEGAEGRRSLDLDVTVNRSALKAMLQRCGVYYTTAGPWPFELGLSGDAVQAWDRLGELQRLTGLTARQGSDTVLSLDLGQGVWSGELTVGGSAWSAQGPDLAAVWFDLWGRFFSRPEVEAGLVRTLTLSMSGWFTPDGVRAFDGVLALWEGEVEQAVLKDVTAAPEGISARWTVKTLDAGALEDRLAAYAPDRGLTWRLER